MATTYPTSKQSFTDPISTNFLNSPSHSGLHTDKNDTIEAIEDQVGYTGNFNFALLAGKSGGQTLIGGTASGDDITIQSTSHATKGNIFLDDKINLWPNTPTSGIWLDAITWDPTITVADPGSTLGVRLIYTNPTITIGAGELWSFIALQAAGTINRSSSALFQLFTLFYAGPTFNINADVSADAVITLTDNSIMNFNNVIASGNKTTQVFVQNVKSVRANISSGTANFGDLIGYKDVPSLKSITAGGTLAADNRYALWVKDVGFTATGTITLTNNYGLYLDNMVVGTSGNRTVTNVYGIYSALQSGTNRWFLYGASTAASYFGGKFSAYDGVSTVGAGIPSLVATVSLTGQTAAIGATTIYAVPAAGAGMYRISWIAGVTTAASTSSTLGGAIGLQARFTDVDDSVVKTTTAINANAMISSANSTGTACSATINANCKASTNLQYLFGYTSSGATPMAYNLHINVEYLG